MSALALLKIILCKNIFSFVHGISKLTVSWKGLSFWKLFWVKFMVFYFNTFSVFDYIWGRILTPTTCPLIFYKRSKAPKMSGHVTNSEYLKRKCKFWLVKLERRIICMYKGHCISICVWRNHVCTEKKNPIDLTVCFRPFYGLRTCSSYLHTFLDKYGIWQYVSYNTSVSNLLWWNNIYHALNSEQNNINNFFPS